MIRLLAAAALLSLVPMADAASAQSYAPAWGQPIYLDAWGRPVGGSPLAEVEARSYAGTGRWADGRHERPYVYVPGRPPAYGYGRPYRHRYASAHGAYGRRPYQGYRDEWGYRDDRPRPGRRGYVDRPVRDDCGCGDVYLYDR